MKTPILVLLLFSASATLCQPTQKVLYELKPDEHIIITDEHRLLSYSHAIGHFLFTTRSDKRIHFIFNGKEVCSLDTLRSFNFPDYPDILFYSRGKRFRFDPFSKKLVGPFSYFGDNPSVEQMRPDHIAFVGVNDTTAHLFLDGIELLSDGVSKLPPNGFVRRLVMQDDGNWIYLLPDSFDEKSNASSYLNRSKAVTKINRKIVLPPKINYIGYYPEISPDRIVSYEKTTSGRNFYLNDSLIFTKEGFMVGGSINAFTNRNNTAISWDEMGVASSRLWINGKLFGPFNEENAFWDILYRLTLGDAPGKYAKVVNSDRQLLVNGKLEDFKSVDALQYNQKTGSYLAINTDQEVIFNGKRLGKFPVEIQYYTTSTFQNVNGKEVETKDSTKHASSLTGFLYDTDHYYFTIKRNEKSFYRLSTGVEVDVALNPVFSRDPAIYGYLAKSNVVIGGKTVGTGFSLIFDPATNSFKWLSLNGRSIIENSYKK